MDETRGDVPSIRAGRHFVVCPIVIAPGSQRPYAAHEWHEALVTVEYGELDLEFASGARWRLPRGAVLWLAPLSLRALHNPGTEPALLIAISRLRHANR